MESSLSGASLDRFVDREDIFSLQRNATAGDVVLAGGELQIYGEIYFYLLNIEGE
jgi:hypothetical protein